MDEDKVVLIEEDHEERDGVGSPPYGVAELAGEVVLWGTSSGRTFATWDGGARITIRVVRWDGLMVTIKRWHDDEVISQRMAWERAVHGLNL
jgi:hypothetical protein